jgi:hypothetical protein
MSLAKKACEVTENTARGERTVVAYEKISVRPVGSEVRPGAD